MRDHTICGFALLDAILLTLAISILSITYMRFAIGASTLRHLISGVVKATEVEQLSCGLRPDLHTLNCRNSNNEEFDVILPW